VFLISAWIVVFLIGFTPTIKNLADQDSIVVELLLIFMALSDISMVLRRAICKKQ
jgi:hypothetical protein